MQLKGSPGSSGVVTARARVLTDIKDVGLMQRGEILVTDATSPIWTPLIHISAGVVTNLGGSLCHAAIVCREYGIPAVVGTKTATKVIKSGQTITLDGTKGTIEINQ